MRDVDANRQTLLCLRVFFMLSDRVGGALSGVSDTDILCLCPLSQTKPQDLIYITLIFTILTAKKSDDRLSFLNFPIALREGGASLHFRYELTAPLAENA